MTDFVVDASVAAKWFLPEEYTDAALLFLDESHSLLAPDLIFAELASVFLKWIRRGGLDARGARDALKTLRGGALEIERTERHIELALDIAVKLGLTAYDGLYVATAAARRCPLVTADRRLYESVVQSRLAGYVLWVENGPS